MLALPVGGVLWDLTLGDGGHAAELMMRGKDTRMVGLDRDPRALEAAGARLAAFGDRVRLVQGRFGDLAALAREGGWPRPDSILMDIGTSTRQLLDAARGFSFMADGPIDMRMGPASSAPAGEIVNAWKEADLERLFRELGEERFAGRIARAIVRRRESRPFERTGDLAACVAASVPGRGRKHPATRVFQALRMHVNDELGELARGLEAALALLPAGSRLGVIAFHSLEDRHVKQVFRAQAAQPGWTLLTKKAVCCAQAERRANPRARSARLRVIRRIAA